MDTASIKPKLKLNNSREMPVIGLGTWLSKPTEVGGAVKAAIKAGYRHIDCAYVYCNEIEVGSALKEVFDEGTVSREDIFLTSKLWQTRHHAKDVRRSVEESLDYLGVDYLDLYLIHSPEAYKRGPELRPKDDNGKIIYDHSVSYLETWKAMEACVDEGLIHSIGLAKFDTHQIQEVIDNSRIRPAVVQMEIHPYLQQHEFVNYCRGRDIAVTAICSFGSPGFTGQHGATLGILEDERLKSIAGRHQKSVTQVILRWLLQRNVIVIPKSVTPSRIQENFQVFDFELSDEDMEEIKNIDRNLSVTRAIQLANASGN